MSAFNDFSYLNNAGLQHLNDRLHNTFRVTSGQSDYANLGNFASSSGYQTNANGDYSYAEGYQTSSIGSFSHSEGLFTNAIGSYSHAEGQNTYSNGEASHAEGYNTRSFGNYSHAEGNKSLANAEFSHAEGGSTTANGLYSHAEGSDTTAFGHSAHAEGATTRSYGVGAHSEGKMTLASGDGAHAEGSSVVSASYSSSKGIISYADGSHAEGRVDGDTSFIKALGLGSHAEGYANLEGTGVNAYGVGSHAEGGSTGAIGDYSHAEGLSTQAIGVASHASGYYTNANGNYSHAEGQATTANGRGSHTEGFFTFANGLYSHAEGEQTAAFGEGSHAEGYLTNAGGQYSHAEGYLTNAFGEGSHAEGYLTNAYGFASHAGGIGTIANAEGATVFGKYSNDSQDILFGIGNGIGEENRSSCFEITNNGYIRQGNAELRFDVNDGVYGFYTNANEDFNPFGGGSIDPRTFRVTAGQNDYANLGNFATSSGNNTNANGNYSHAEGRTTTAEGIYSHAEGYETNATGKYSHAEGQGTKANGNYSHAEGSGRTSGSYSHAEGGGEASGSYSHAEGGSASAYGNYSHAEGYYTKAYGNYSHAEGSRTTAYGNASHAEGSNTTAYANYSHAGGIGTIANAEGATVFGKYSNDVQDILFGIGNGNDAANRSSCFEITTDGFIRTGDTKIRFGVDANGNYGYIKPGADTVYPFKSSEEKIKVNVKAATRVAYSPGSFNNFNYDSLLNNQVVSLKLGYTTGGGTSEMYPCYNNNTEPFLKQVLNSDSNLFVLSKYTIFPLNNALIPEESHRFLENLNNAYTVLDYKESGATNIADFFEKKQDYKPYIVFNSMRSDMVFYWRGRSDNNSSIANFNSYYYHYLGSNPSNTTYPSALFFNNILLNQSEIDAQSYIEGQNFVKNKSLFINNKNIFSFYDYLYYGYFNGSSSYSSAQVNYVSNFINRMLSSNNGCNFPVENMLVKSYINDFTSRHDTYSYSFYRLYNFRLPFLNYYVNTLLNGLVGPRYSYLVNNAELINKGLTNLYLDSMFSYFRLSLQSSGLGQLVYFPSSRFQKAFTSINSIIWIHEIIFGAWDDEI